MTRRTLVVALVLAGGGAHASGAAPDPSAPGAPSTPAPQTPAQPPGPKDALKRLAAAMRKGDAAEIRAVLYAADDTEAKMAAAMADYAAALAGLQKSAVAAFGEEGAKELTGDAPPGEEVARIDAAALSVDGDDATVTFVPDKKDVKPPAGQQPKGEEEDPPPPPEPVRLKKVDGHWRVPVAGLSKGAAPEEVKQRLADLAAQTKLIQEISTEVAAGKYKSAEKAGEAWRMKVYALTPMPSTQPTTRPAADKPAKPAGPDVAGAAREGE